MDRLEAADLARRDRVSHWLITALRHRSGRRRSAGAPTADLTAVAWLESLWLPRLSARRLYAGLSGRAGPVRIAASPSYRGGKLAGGGGGGAWRTGRRGAGVQQRSRDRWLPAAVPCAQVAGADPLHGGRRSSRTAAGASPRPVNFLTLPVGLTLPSQRFPAFLVGHAVGTPSFEFSRTILASARFFRGPPFPSRSPWCTQVERRGFKPGHLRQMGEAFIGRTRRAELAAALLQALPSDQNPHL